jgi:hypothetical protein
MIAVRVGAHEDLVSAVAIAFGERTAAPGANAGRKIY